MYNKSETISEILKKIAEPMQYAQSHVEKLIDKWYPKLSGSYFPESMLNSLLNDISKCQKNIWKDIPEETKVRLYQSSSTISAESQVHFFCQVSKVLCTFDNNISKDLPFLSQTNRIVQQITNQNQVNLLYEQLIGFFYAYYDELSRSPITEGKPLPQNEDALSLIELGMNWNKSDLTSYIEEGNAVFFISGRVIRDPGLAAGIVNSDESIIFEDFTPVPVKEKDDDLAFAFRDSLSPEIPSKGEYPILSQEAKTLFHYLTQTFYIKGARALAKETDFEEANGSAFSPDKAKTLSAIAAIDAALKETKLFTHQEWAKLLTGDINYAKDRALMYRFFAYAFMEGRDVKKLDVENMKQLIETSPDGELSAFCERDVEEMVKEYNKAVNALEHEDEPDYSDEMED